MPEPQAKSSKPIKKREIAMFFRELSILTDVGMPLIESLKTMAARCHNKNLSTVITALHANAALSGECPISSR